MSVLFTACLPTGVHEGNDGGLEEHHPQPRLQWLGGHGGRAAGEARSTSPRHGVLERQRTGTGMSASM